MYDLPEIRHATDAWWDGLTQSFRREGVTDPPVRLYRPPETEAIWKRPDLFLTQICGFNFACDWRGRLTYVATPCYSAPGCFGPNYRSFIVVRVSSGAHTLEDLRGSTCAINGHTSQSGCNAFRFAVAPLTSAGAFFGSEIVSGSHVESLKLVSSGRADLAAIDCITYELLRRHRSAFTDATRVLAETVVAPVGPYVARADIPEEKVRQLQRGLMRAAMDPRLASVRAELCIRSFEVLSSEAYDCIRDMERETRYDSRLATYPSGSMLESP
jgi:ABC-type phosphate/phosphonate transport system substrate-binding protein